MGLPEPYLIGEIRHNAIVKFCDVTPNPRRIDFKTYFSYFDDENGNYNK